MELSRLVALLQSVFPPEAVVFILSFIPIVEIQASLPIAYGVYHFPVWKAMLIAIAGNLVPVFIVIYGWDWIIRFAKQHSPRFHAFMQKYHERLHKKAEQKIDKYGPYALILFMSIPLPFSGIWSASMIAWIFGIHKRQAIMSLFIGVIISVAVVTAIAVPSLRIF